MSATLGGLSRRIVPWLLRRRRAVLAAALLGTALFGVLSARLYGDLRSGLEELLPESAPSVLAARQLGPRLHGTSRLSVDLEGNDPDALERFADDLAVRLRALPADLVESVDYRNDETDAFVRRFGLLYVAEEDLTLLHDRIAARVAWEKRAKNPLAVDLLEGDGASAPGAPPAIPLADLEAKYAARTGGGAGRFRKGYYQTRDGRLLVLQVRAPEASTGLDRNRRLLEAVRSEVLRLRPASYDPALQVGYSGEVAELVEEQSALVSDLAASTAVVTVLVLVALWIFFRRWSAMGAVLGSLAAGCALTFGLSDLLIGHLNANTAFLGSIVLGNGINVAIIVVGRYLEERRAGVPLEEAIRLAWEKTLSATFVAAFGAGLAYLSLASTGFRGFSQFGVIGALGMALCWLCAYLLLPPLLYVLDAGRPIAVGPSRSQGAAFAWLARCIEARPTAFLSAGAAVLLGCAAAMAGYRGELMEHDPTRLRARHSLTSGALHWSQKADRVFEAYLTPVVLWSETPEGLERALSALERRRAALGARDPFREVTSLSSSVPAPQAQERRLQLAAQIRAQLTPSLLRRLDPALRERVVALLPAGDLRAVTFADLPADLRRALSERDGTVGRVALAFPRKTGRLDLSDVEDIKELVRSAFADAGVPALAFNPLLLLSDIDDAIWRDGPRATLIALALVCALVMVVLRKASASAAVLGGLLVGFAGLLGVAAAAGARANFLNFVVLPITLGIGVDYAVNIVQRQRQEPGASIVRLLRETGGAVALCSATTVIGYGSLLVADSQALAGFGLLAALGEVTCLLAALVVLPAWLSRSAQLRARGEAEPRLAA